jgi:CubicO group peptidase (beta-lactamase class C family)
MALHSIGLQDRPPPPSEYGGVQLRAASPIRTGLRPEGLRDIETLLDEGITGGVFPGAVALIARGDQVGWQTARGDAQRTPSRRPANTGTLYDLASLTKISAALPVAVSLWQQGRLDLDARVGSVVGEFSGEGREAVTFRHLLAHTSGLPAWKALYLEGTTPEAILAAVCRTPLSAAPGTAVEYSDLGILLLGAAMERIAGRRIDALVREWVVAPLGLTDTMYTPAQSLWGRCAATEEGNVYERDKVGAAGAGFPWREHVLCGEVHDGNAHYGLQGIAPHAGLFSTAWDVGTLALQWLRPGRLLMEAAVREATADQRRGADGYPRGLGWVLHHEGTFFEALGPRAFGHTGFTGTSVAVDPDEDLIVVLLTNRVHLGGGNTKIQEFRPRFHAAVARAARR